MGNIILSKQVVFAISVPQKSVERLTNRQPTAQRLKAFALYVLIVDMALKSVGGLLLDAICQSSERHQPFCERCTKLPHRQFIGAAQPVKELYGREVIEAVR
jgi:hypothetical protein